MKRGRTIAMPTSSFLPNLGGAEVGLHNIAKRLKSRGHRPIVIAPHPHVRTLRDEAWPLPYEILPFPPKLPGAVGRLPWLGLHLVDGYFGLLQRRFGFDVWHGTMGYPVGVALAHFAAARSIPHVVRCAGEDIQRTPEIGYGARLDPKVDRLVRDWLPRAQRVVAITDTVAAEYRALGISDDRIVPIPNGVDLERFSGASAREATRRSLGVTPGEVLFIAVGRNHRKKNFGALLAAARQMADAGADGFRILLVGSGCDLLATEAAGLGIRDKILALPEVRPGNKADLQLPADELVSLYQAADVFAFPSLLETFGIVLVEAMAAGLPVITTDGPGCRDIIPDGADGMMVAAGSAAELAQAMTRMMSTEVRRDYAVKSLARATQFSWDSVVDAYERLYESAIAELHPTRPD